MVLVKRVFTRNKSKSDIRDREIKNWLKDGLKKGYGFSHLRQILVSHGLRKEADKLIHFFPKAVKSKKERAHSHKTYFIKFAGAILLFLWAFLFVSVSILNNGGFILTGHLISNSENPGALINVNFSSEIGEVRGDFYGANVHSSWLRNGLTIDADGNGTHESLANTTWHRQMFLDAGLRYAREDAGIDSCYYVNASNVSQWSRTCSLTNLIDEYAWAKNNGVRILNILSYMPSGLRNLTAQCSVDPQKCQPLDYDVWGKILVDYINATTNNGQYLSIVDYEIWNEPDLHQFLQPNLSVHGSQSSADIYVKLYNSSWTDIRAVYQNATIVGPALAHIDIYTNITFSFLSNFSDRMDGFSFHDYYPADPQSVQTRINDALTYCSTYSANCSRILMDEYNYKNLSNVGGGMELSNSALSEFYADIFASGLNSYPSNLSLMIYQWSEQEKYLPGIGYSEYPSRWSMVSEPRLDNAIYASYNITKNFATYHSAGSMVVRSNSSSSNIKVVASKKNDSQYITIINAGAETDVGLNISGTTISEIKDLESGEVYNVENGEVYIGTISQYQIRYFVNLSNYVPPAENPPSVVNNGGGSSGGGGGSGTRLNESINTSLIKTSNSTNVTKKSEEVIGKSENNETQIENSKKSSSIRILNFILISLVIGIVGLMLYTAIIFMRIRKYDNLTPH